MAQQPNSPLAPIDHAHAIEIASSQQDLLQWNKDVDTLIQQGNATNSQSLFKNVATIAEIIRERHPHSGNRSHPERDALGTYDRLVADRTHYSDLANGVMIGTGKLMSEGAVHGRQFINEKTRAFADLSSAELMQNVTRQTAASVDHAIDTTKAIYANPEVIFQVAQALPATASHAWNEKLDHLAEGIKQGMRSTNPGEEIGIVVAATTGKELVEMRGRSIQAIEQHVVGPIEAAAKKYHAAQDELRAASKLAHPEANADTHYDKHLAQVNADQKLSDYEQFVQHKIQDARHNTPHTSDDAKSQYKNPIDTALLKDHLTPHELDRLHSISRHDVPQGHHEVEDGRWLLVTKFADPTMRPRIIGVGFDEEQARFTTVSLDLNQGTSVFQNALTSPKSRIQEAQEALRTEWERNAFEGIHAPIHEAVKNFPDDKANTIIRRIEENHARMLDADDGVQR